MSLYHNTLLLDGRSKYFFICFPSYGMIFNSSAPSLLAGLPLPLATWGGSGSTAGGGGITSGKASSILYFSFHYLLLFRAFFLFLYRCCLLFLLWIGAVGNGPLCLGPKRMSVIPWSERSIGASICQ